MQIEHDDALALEEVMLVVNHDERDVLATPAALAAFLDQRHVTGSRAGDDAELRAMRRLRATLRRVFELAAEGDRAEVVEAINRLIAQTGAVPRLVEHDGHPPHLHYTPFDAPVHHRLGAEMAIALAILVRDSRLDRLRLCAAPDCDNVVVDLSKNRSRRYCSTRCANRQHVAAYRQRQAAG